MANQPQAPTITPGTRVINYHYIKDPTIPFVGSTGVSAPKFRQQLVFMKESSDKYLVTFDDGSKSILSTGLSILKQFDIPIILFVCSMPLMEKGFWMSPNTMPYKLSLERRNSYQSLKERSEIHHQILGTFIRITDYWAQCIGTMMNALSALNCISTWMFLPTNETKF